MKKIFGLIVILSLLLAAVPVGVATAVPSDLTFCVNPLDPLLSGIPVQSLGSNICYWVPPTNWNGDLVIFAHGYMDPLTPPGTIPWDQLIIVDPTDPTNLAKAQFLPGILAKMGYGFAVTSYPKNGLAVQEGVEAVKNVANLATSGTLPFLYKPVGHIFLVGASEGGLVTSLAIERETKFDGGVTTCGPVGNFKGQINYWGDFRVILDVLFPDLKAKLNVLDPATGAVGSPVNIPAPVRLAWGQLVFPTPPGWPLNALNTLQGQVSAALLANPTATAQLLLASRAPIDTTNATTQAVTTDLTVRGLLDYNIKATNEARFELAGAPVNLATNDYQPFNNAGRFYFGLSWAQNAAIERFSVDQATLQALGPYETTGSIKAPLVAMHTTGDPFVPYWHEPLYLYKVWRAGQLTNFFTIPILRYGHCAFTATEAIFAFSVMVFKATGQLPPLALLAAGPNLANQAPVLTQDEFYQMYQKYAPQQEPPNTIYLPMMRK